MAFSSTIDGWGTIGSRRKNWGTYTNGSGDTGGNIDSGLAICEFFLIKPKGSSVIATASTVNETLPIAGSAITIVTADNEDGYWEAWGY